MALGLIVGVMTITALAKLSSRQHHEHHAAGGDHHYPHAAESDHWGWVRLLRLGCLLLRVCVVLCIVK